MKFFASATRWLKAAWRHLFDPGSPIDDLELIDLKPDGKTLIDAPPDAFGELGAFMEEASKCIHWDRRYGECRIDPCNCLRRTMRNER
ncbi:MAG: hypothetical protein AAGF28_07530 [Pseudomonadota bacterium]